MEWAGSQKEPVTRNYGTSSMPYDLGIDDLVRGWGFEFSNRRIHFWFKRPIPKCLLFVLSSAGFGLTYLPWRSDFLVNSGKIKYRVDLSGEGVQAELERVLDASPFLRSMSIRTSFPLDLTSLENKKSLRSVYTSSPVLKPINFAKTKKLRLLGLERNVRQARGLHNLKRLDYVYLGSGAQGNLAALPSGIKTLIVASIGNRKLDLSRFADLRHLELGGAKHLNFAELKLSRKLKTLTLSSVRTISCFDVFISDATCLRIVKLDDCGDEVIKLVTRGEGTRSVTVVQSPDW